METRRNKRDEWIKLASKSRPGRYYMFNKSTGETRWLPLPGESSPSGSKIESPPKIQVSKSGSKTPAQDRLKRLQHNLKANQLRSQPAKATRQSSEADGKIRKKSVESQEQENCSKNLPSTSSPTKGETKSSCSSPKKYLPSPKRANKRPHETCASQLTEDELEIISKSVKTSPNAKKTTQIPETSKTSTPPNTNRELGTDAEKAASNSCTVLETRKDITNNENDAKSSTLNNLRIGIVNKIKEICKIPFSSPKKQHHENSNDKEKRSTSNLKHTTHFKPAKKTEDNKRLSATLQEALFQLKAEKDKSTESSKHANTSSYSTPKNLNVPSYQRGSANTRLERLRQSLQLQQPSTSATAAANFSFLSEEESTRRLQLPTALNASLNTSVYQTANNTINNEVEAMDWQSIDKEEPIETSSSDSIISNKSKRPSVEKVDKVNDGTMSDIYDTVNENLLRFSAEKQKDSSINSYKKWQKEYYYFVVDTNVLLSNLCFIEDLSKMKLCDTKGSMLYIPYCVLQELDKLKMRSGSQEGVKTLAVRAIKYLNTKFENKSTHLQAQSALEERNHLIDINSADDSIINCCLQAKAHVPNLLFLTEDVNLRNKAICNNILVSTKSDLVSKHYDTNES